MLGCNRWSKVAKIHLLRLNLSQKKSRICILCNYLFNYTPLVKVYETLLCAKVGKGYKMATNIASLSGETSLCNRCQMH